LILRVSGFGILVRQLLRRNGSSAPSDESSFARFRSPDPTGQEPNPYNYAQGDPINNSDPTGAGTGSTWGAAIGGFVGGAVVGALVVTCPATAGAGCIAAGGVMTALGAVGGGGQFVSGLKRFL